MSRHRKIKLSRSKAIVIAAAGALSVATAASAAAAVGTQGTQGHSAGPAEVSDAGAHQAAAGATQLVVTDQLALPIAAVANQQSANQQSANQQSANQQSANQQSANEQGSAIFVEHADQLRLAQTRAAIAQRQAASKRAAVAAKQAAAAPSPAAAQTPAAAQPSQTATATIPAASGSPQQIAEAMLGSFGWSGSQFSCLDPLWAHESGWSVSAYNAGSGAFGIPQALPGSRMASAGPDWQTDAATQIRWGLEYIKGTYGSPCGAWAHEEATGWY